MLPITAELKKNIQKYESIEERLVELKDKYVGETAYVTACGPSINILDSNILKSKLYIIGTIDNNEITNR